MSTLLEYTAGSTFFKLNEEGSDLDLIRVTFDPFTRLDASKQPPKTVVEGDTLIVELGDFLLGVEEGELRYAEVTRKPPTAIKNYPLYTLLQRFFEPNSRPGYPEMYRKEITRRFNKSFYSEYNGKRATEEKFDPKYAAHYFRVLTQAESFIVSKKVQVDFSPEFRDEYLKIKHGEYTRSELATRFHPIQQQVLSQLSEVTVPKQPLQAFETYLRIVRAYL